MNAMRTTATGAALLALAASPVTCSSRTGCGSGAPNGHFPMG
jgi:hypothetical protein